MSRKFFAAMTSGFNMRICENTGSSLRAMLSSRLTKTEQRQYRKFVSSLMSREVCDRLDKGCDLHYGHFPHGEDEAKAIEQFVVSVEKRHGLSIWSR